MKMIQLLLTFAVCASLLGAGQPSPARKNSTPEDRAKAVEIARALELEPLGKQSKEQRNWMVHWLIEVPDINVKVCGNLLGPLLGSTKNYASEIFNQMIPASAAFIISNPEKAQDNVAVYAAALEGSLHAYESILKLKPKAKWPYLDDLLVKRSRGELPAYVREVAAKCK